MASNSVFPLAWHAECIRNFEKNLMREEIALKEHISSVIRMRGNLAFYREQMAEAERRRLAKFDSSKLLVKPKTK